MSESALAKTVEALRARLRHAYSVRCDRCGDTLTLSSMTVAALEPHLLRTALELGWLVSSTTAKSLGSTSASTEDRCPHCCRLLVVHPAPVTSTR